MADFVKNEVPKLSETHPKLSNEPVDSKLQRLVHRTRSVSISIPMNSMEPYERETNLVGHTGPLRSESEGSKFHNAIYGDGKGWARRLFVSLTACVPKVMNPHAKVVQQWNKFFVICCLVGIFVDPLVFFLPSVRKEYKCVTTNWTMVMIYVLLRSMIDFIYFVNILLQFRLAYVAPESRVVGARELVDHPKKIALHYLQTYFVVDFFIVIPLPQIMILFVIPNLELSGAKYLLSQKLSYAVVLFQYIPRLFRILPMLIYPPPGFRIVSEWANIFINLLIFMLSSHVVGSCWYHFGLQRVNQCLREACIITRINGCTKFIDCEHGIQISKQYQPDTNWVRWKNNTYANTCFTGDGLDYGIYLKAVNLTAGHNVITRYVYSLFWGFQQISSLASNLNPSYFVWEVLFTMAIIGLGLFVFALLIGNIQNFLQAFGRRRLEMSLRRRDVERWMYDQRFSEHLKRRVRQAERFSWDATRGVNEELLLENLPEDLQRDIRRHKFKFVKKVGIFALMDEPILDAICERLKQKTYIKGSKILYNGGMIEKMVFVVQGKLESISEDGTVPLSEGAACGEELLKWCLEHHSMNKDGGKVRNPGQWLLSNRTVCCLTNVKACSLRAADLEEVISLFPRFSQNPRVQAAIRYESPYWRCLAATRIQVAWRYRKKRLSRALHNQMKY